MSQAGPVQDPQSSSSANGAGSMSQTPTLGHHIAGLLALIPPASRRLVEIGCSTGARAREWRRLHPDSDWFGVDVDPVRAALAQCSGGDAVAAVNDAQAFQYLLRAVPE